MKKRTLSTRLSSALWPLLLLLVSWTPVLANDPPVDEETRVKQKVDYVVNNRLLVSQLDPNSLSTLPIGIVREIDGKSFIIAVDSARITPTGGFFSAYAAVKLPNTADDDFLAFAAKNVSFKPNGGIGVSSATRLMLVSPRTIHISEKVDLVLPADGDNYIEWDCNGFQSISLKGQFVFDPSMITPDVDNPSPNDKVTATFQVVGQRGFNFLLTTSISPFRIKGLGDLSFAVTDATVDLSDLSNPTDFYYPTDYPSYFGGNSELWRGFFLKSLTVKLPKGMATSQGRASFTAQNVVIDDMGFSGNLGVKNLFDIHTGSIDGWAFSVDTINMQILQNRLVGGALGGTMNLPFLKTDTLGYNAAIEQRDGELNFNFIIRTLEAQTYNMAWGGTLTLDAGSQVMVKKQNGQFTAGALLHGSLTMEKDILNVDQVKFQNLELTTANPYIIRGTFALTNSSGNSTQSRMAKFPISVSNIGFGIDNSKIFLKADVSLNLMNEDAKGFKATTSVKILATANSTNQTLADGTNYKKQTWLTVDDIEISTISLAAKMGSLDLAGTLNLFRDDAVYGNGFRGNVSLKFPPLKNSISANVYFGSKVENGEDYRYWQANVFVPLQIPIVEPVVLTGILGGASYHMKRNTMSPEEQNKTFQALTTSNIPTTQNGSAIANREVTPEFKYRPDINAGLGILAGVTLAVKKDEIINADATLDVVFNTNGGINQIKFDGGAYFFSASSKRTRSKIESDAHVISQSSAPVKAYISVLYDNPNKVFHASIKTYVNLAGVAKGLNSNDGLVGEAVVHVDPDVWYLYIGRPSQMMGMELLSIVKMKSYFMMGKRLEQMPAPPPQIASILGGNWTPPSYATIMENGGGFGFGAHFQAKFPQNGEFTMGPFYAGFDIGAGADILITQFNGQVNCGGNIRTPGIDGWYAAGQVYAYLQGSIGIKVRKKKFSIIDVGAAAILQARLPNPTFMKGAIGGKFRILGGLIKGSVRFSFTIGENCVPVGGGSELDNIKVVESVAPENGAGQVSVFAQPTATLNTLLDAELPIMEDDGQVHTYRVILDSIGLYQENTYIQGSLPVQEIKDKIVYKPGVILNGNTDFKFRIKLKWQEKINYNWVNPGNSPTPDIEIAEYRFKTNDAPASLVVDNIENSYPVSRQYNVYKNQSTQGFVKLKMGQPEVLNLTDGYGSWRVFARYTDRDGNIIDTAATSVTATAISFPIPGSLLQANKVYTLSLIKRPNNPITVFPRRDLSLTGFQNVYVSESITTLREMNAGFSMVNAADQLTLDSASTTRYNPFAHLAAVPPDETTTNGTGGTASNEVVIYRINFRTSMYNTMSDKLTALTNENNTVSVMSGNLTAIGKRFNAAEGFDDVELLGRGNNGVPLLRPWIGGNDWLTTAMIPLMYEYYGNDYNIGITWRDIGADGNSDGHIRAPMRSARIHCNSNPNGYALTDDQVTAGFAPARPDEIMMANYISWFCAKDYQELRNKAAAVYLTYTEDQVQTLPPQMVNLLMTTGFTDLTPGFYPLRFQYHLPGNNQYQATPDAVQTYYTTFR